MKRSIFILLLLVFVNQIGFSQSDITWPKFKGSKTFTAYMESILSGNLYVTNSDCAEFMLAAKFVIDQNGFIDSIRITTKEKMSLKFLIMDALETTNGTWEPMKIDGKINASYPMVLPIHFKLESEDRMLSFKEVLEFDPNNKDELVTVFNPINVFGVRGFEDIGGPPKKNNKN